uniref:Uncharacterized protein n=1 Tax=Megaselia scalaris TaxID=36166 RepID=T1GXH2_MEGSC
MEQECCRYISCSNPFYTKKRRFTSIVR